MKNDQSSFVVKVNSKSSFVKVNPKPNGFIHRRFSGMTLSIYNRRGKLILWSGGRWMPVNGPALWVTLVLCLIVGFIGGHL